jgi:hypothetical protein
VSIMKNYTDEELSRILGEHDAGLLVVGGSSWVYMLMDKFSCANQAAYNESCPYVAVAMNLLKGNIFDRCYLRDCSPEELLQLLQGEK